LESLKELISIQNRGYSIISPKENTSV